MSWHSVFVDDAGKVWHKLWSVRLMLLCGLVEAADSGYEVWVTGQPPWQALVASALAFAAAFARVVRQPKLRRGRHG